MRRKCLIRNTNTEEQNLYDSDCYKNHLDLILSIGQFLEPRYIQYIISFDGIRTICLIIILAFAYSCKSDLEKANEEIKGTWKLESMQYEDSTGAVKVVCDQDVTLIFTNDQSSISADDSGIQIIGSDTTYFEYYVSDLSCCFYFDETKYNRSYLTDFISMCYDFNKINKKTIEFYSNFGFDYVTNEKLYNTSYLYTKLSK